MAKATEHHLKQRGGRWHFRLRVPRDLIDRIEPGRRVEHIQKALGTSDLREAQRLRNIALGDWEARFDRLREGKPITADELDAIGRGEVRRVYDWAVRDFHTGKVGDAIELAVEELQGDGWQDGPDGETVPTPWRWQAEQAIEAAGIPKSDETVEAVRQALLNAHLQGLESFQAGLEPPVPGQSTFTRTRRRLGSGVAFSEAADQYLADQTRDPDASLTKQTVAQMRATFRLFADHVGDCAVDAVTRADGVEFLSRMSGLGAHYGKRPDAKTLSLSELLEKYPGPPFLTNKTLNRHQSALKGLYRWASLHFDVLADRANPFHGLARKKAKTSETARLPMTVEELNALFAGETFDTKPKSHTLITARPWVTAIGLFGGMRLAEITELDAEDIKREGKVWFFDITESKSEAGVRRVPVHSRLVKLGLLDYVGTIGSGPLFPGITPAGIERKRAATFTKRFTTYRRECGVTRDRVTFHSLRKNFVRAIELANVDRDRTALVVGHERGFTFSVYNPEGVDMLALRRVVEAVSYQGLRLS